MQKPVLVHLASGVGNIVFATPLLRALSSLDLTLDVLLDADYPATIELLRPWAFALEAVFHSHAGVQFDGYTHLIPAIPPFYWPRFRHLYHSRKNTVSRPPDTLFYSNEQEYYLAFAKALGYSAASPPCYSLPIPPSDHFAVNSKTLVIAPGCKTGEMGLKRWPFFVELADCFSDVAVVGTSDDLRAADGKLFRFPPHVKSYVGELSLRQTAELLASAGAVVGNDSGLSHIAGAVGTPTLILFGPTPHLSLGRFPKNVRVLRTDLPCEPCWFANRFRACNRRVDCLRQLGVAQVVVALSQIFYAATRDPLPAIRRVSV